MAAQNPLQRLKLGQFADRFRNEMIPLGSRICYFCAAVSLSQEDLREYLDEPVAALPPVLAALLPEVRILLVPYLERAATLKTNPGEEPMVSTEKPADAQSLHSGYVVSGSSAVLGFAVKDAEVADYHYRFYRSIAELVAGDNGDGVPPDYADLVMAELRGEAHGEVDDPAWQLKIDLTAKDRTSVRHTKRLREYLRQSFVDTLTLYTHGICCDIDVETGPRQLPSHLLRKRLRMLKGLYPPPQGYSVLPEDLK